ncbi:hypothetical protein M5K25_010186 [Dendrobium thyrsiflorum]|uniref:Uncharacterized protein n=1 Tax=Dendrobium thyrsiflorum TaxID=117978 RepID=A0ABD0V627_DENTH
MSSFGRVANRSFFGLFSCRIVVGFSSSSFIGYCLTSPTLLAAKNSDMFYGNSTYLYVISPVSRVLTLTRKEKNFLYNHLHPTRRVYEAIPSPLVWPLEELEGMHERILIDEDFLMVVIRHHAVNKAYQHDSLIPISSKFNKLILSIENCEQFIDALTILLDVGYLPVEASLLEAKGWGFGGSSAK